MFNRGRKVADERGGRGRERERCSRSIFHFNAAAPESALFAGVLRAKKDTVAEPVSASLAASQKRFDNW
jgi:hypothetical protein